MVLQLPNSKHRSETRGSNRHRVSGLNAVRQRNQPVGLDTRLLGIAAPMHFAHPPTGKHYCIARLINWAVRNLYHTSEVDPWNMRILPHQPADPV